MAKSNAERQAKWREKNRALFNLRRRNARKGGGAKKSERRGACPSESTIAETSAPSPTATIEELRQLIATESEKPVPEPVKPVVYRDDYGRVITWEQWEKMQETKAKAKAGGYEVDAWSQ